MRIDIKHTSNSLILILLALGYLSVNLLSINSEVIYFIRITATTLILINLINNNYIFLHQKSDILIFGLMSIISITTSQIALNMLFIWIFVLFSKNLELELITRQTKYTMGLAIAFSLTLLALGATENQIDSTGSIIGDPTEVRNRNTFGYKNVNSFATLLTGFCLLLILQSKKYFFSSITTFIILYIFYLSTDSRAMVLCVFLFFLILLTLSFLSKYPFLIKSLILFLAALPITLTILSSQIASTFPFIDLLISHRLFFTAEYFSSLPIHSWIIGGTDPTDTQTIDNSFALLIGTMGIPFVLLTTFNLYKFSVICFYAKETKLMAFLLCFWIYSFIESNLIRPETLICLVFWIFLFNGKTFLKSVEQKNENRSR